MARANRQELSVARRVVCHACSTALDTEDPIGRSARCAQCGAELRICLNCRFHDVSAYNDCAEPSAERVLEKDRANFCDYFSPGSAGTGAAASTCGKPDGLSELEKLFRK
jgi:hypothetical protein